MIFCVTQEEEEEEEEGRGREDWKSHLLDKMHFDYLFSTVFYSSVIYFE